MSKLYISEHKGVRQAEGGLAQVPIEPGTDQAPVTFAASVASLAFGEGTKLVRVQSDVDCHILFGGDPTATVNNKPLTANTPEYFGVIEGQKVAAIAAV